MTKSFNTAVFSKYRSELMGVATLLIVIFHMPVFGVVMPNWMDIIFRSCGFGVDIFLFLSGVGMHHSYSSKIKNKQSVFYWLFKRYIRIICPLFILITPFLFYNIIYNDQAVYIAILQLSGFGSLLGCSPLWFISCILMLYLITPIIHPLLVSKRSLFYLIVLSILCYSYAYLPPHNSLVHFMVSRWPIYFLGYMLSASIKRQEEGSFILYIVIPVICYIVLYAFNHFVGSHFCLFGLQGIAMVTFFALIIDAYSNEKLKDVLRFLGVISLESYITNEYLMRSLQSITWSVGNFNFSLGNWTFYLVGFCLCMVASFVANRLARKISHFLI